MSEEKFEVAFSGKISEGAELAEVKAKVAHMFKADETKLSHLFSGKRIVIKKDLDEQTANKYKSALNKAGAECEVKNLDEKIDVKTAENINQPSNGNVKVTTPEISIPAPSAPDTDPLHISAEQIEDLSLTVAPSGSDMQNEMKTVAEASFDISGLDMAPVGSDIASSKKTVAPELPDTSGLKFID